MHVGTFAARDNTAGALDQFGAQALAAGDAIAMQVGCRTAIDPTAVSVTAPGWVFELLAPPGGGNPMFTAQLVAVAPDTNPVTVTVQWSGTTCESGAATLADEFRNVDLSSSAYGGLRTGVGDAAFTFNTIGDAATLWAGCFSAGTAVSVGNGFSPGANNGGGDIAGYRITTDPAGTPETPMFTNTGAWAVDIIELKPL